VADILYKGALLHAHMRERERERERERGGEEIDLKPSKMSL